MNDTSALRNPGDAEATHPLAISAMPEGIEVALSADPRLADALERYIRVPYSKGALDPKVRDFIGLAVNASTTHLFEPAIRVHIRSAIDLGATADELVEVLELASALGIHTATVSMPVLREELADAGQAADDAELSDYQRGVKARFSEGRNSWTSLLEDFLRLDADWLSAYVDYSMVPWRRGVLSPKVKELIYIAIDAQTSHLYAPGTRFHIRNALGYGATAEEITEVLELVSLIGFHTLTLAMPILSEELSRIQRRLFRSNSGLTMKFGLFYELQLPRPWDEDAEIRLYDDTLAQVELADQVGIEYVWAVEHHFLEEHSHCSAPEVFLAACSQRTASIRLGHGVMVMTPPYNHPARAAERIATLDLVSHGRVEWGTGESSAALETEAFQVDHAHKRAMWAESVEQAANMLSMRPYPGFKGEHFEMPCRNLVPKPAQKPHPPIWLGCSRRETIHRAARHGLGVLAFGFVEPEQAAHWVKEYYDIIKSSECVPIGRTVNPNFAVVCALSIDEDEGKAVAKAQDGFRFFGYTLGWSSVYGRHKPGRTSVWDSFREVRDQLPQHAGRGAVGTPAQVREHLERYEAAGVDQVIFAQQCGRNRHEDICDSLRLFATAVMPEFKGRDSVRQRAKAAELAPFIERALERRRTPEPLADKDIPVVEAFGLRSGRSGTDGQRSRDISDRGGGIPVPGTDPRRP